MTAKKFITDQWEPLPIDTSDKEKPTKSIFSDIKFRHVLFFISITLAPVAAIGLLIFDSWGVSLAIISLAGILFAFSALLVPVKIYQMNNKK